ncbi:MAG: ribosome maturation factor RimP [Proteobacteria bacterium]|nr:ribosome maturation factor RimP [Pseudomonadota bacterium]MDE3207849.1 ribosome maturation factor RimP [Pseudomonadota bacterium]
MDLSGLLNKTLSGLGYELVELELSGHGRLVRIFIDKPGGVTIDDCTLVSNHVSRLLAVEFDYDYDRLEVSSPGLDRPLNKEADFERFSGERIRFKTRTPVNGQRNFSGVLKGIQNGTVQLEVDGGMLEFSLDDLIKTRLIPNI